MSQIHNLGEKQTQKYILKNQNVQSNVLLNLYQKILDNTIEKALWLGAADLSGIGVPNTWRE